MLVLARRVGESIVIGEGDKQVVVTVQQIKGSQVRLSLQAPPAVRIWRAELRPLPEDKNAGTA